MAIRVGEWTEKNRQIVDITACKVNSPYFLLGNYPKIMSKDNFLFYHSWKCARTYKLSQNCYRIDNKIIFISALSDTRRQLLRFQKTFHHSHSSLIVPSFSLTQYLRRTNNLWSYNVICITSKTHFTFILFRRWVVIDEHLILTVQLFQINIDLINSMKHVDWLHLVIVLSSMILFSSFFKEEKGLK